MPDLAPTPPSPLLTLTRKLLESAETLRPLVLASGPSPLDDLLLLLRLKVIPELDAPRSLPIFVGIQGGTNSGKSTIFNALAGLLLSPAVVLASATKHPLTFLHGRWRETFTRGTPFPGIEIEELSDPKQLIVDPQRTKVLYLRFHDDERLANIALIDSPDFDSDLASNAAGAAWIAAICDISLFVTTDQKYKDRVLLEELRRLLALKDQVTVIFNRMDEEIVFETLREDLRSALGSLALHLETLRLATSRAKHPEDELRAALLPGVLDRLGGLQAVRVKPAIIARTLRGALDHARTLVDRYTIEASFKKEVKKLAAEGAKDARRDYEASFRLSFPEETLAIGRIIRVTELGRWFELGKDVEGISRILELVGGVLRRLNDGTRRWLLRLSTRDEGIIDTAQGNLAEYAQSRNAADTEEALRVTEGLRVQVESFVRKSEDGSAFARELVRTFLTPALASGFPGRVRELHAAGLASARSMGHEVLPAVERWLSRHPGKARALAAGALTIKLGLGGLLAWSLPPAEGLLAFIHPLKWIEFAAGYFVGAYLVALMVSRVVRRRNQFKEARVKVLDDTVKKALLEPLTSAMDELLEERELKKISRLCSQMADHPELQAMGSSRPD